MDEKRHVHDAKGVVSLIIKDPNVRPPKKKLVTVKGKFETVEVRHRSLRSVRIHRRSAGRGRQRAKWNGVCHHDGSGTGTRCDESRDRKGDRRNGCCHSDVHLPYCQRQQKCSSLAVIFCKRTFLQALFSSRPPRRSEILVPTLPKWGLEGPSVALSSHPAALSHHEPSFRR